MLECSGPFHQKVGPQRLKNKVLSVKVHVPEKLSRTMWAMLEILKKVKKADNKILILKEKS